MKKLLVVWLIGFNGLAMDGGSMEGEFYKISLQLAQLMVRQENAIKLAGEYDEANNGLMAAYALDDWHRENDERQRLKGLGKELAKDLSQEVVDRICRQAIIEALK